MLKGKIYVMKSHKAPFYYSLCFMTINRVLPGLSVFTYYSSISTVRIMGSKTVTYCIKRERLFLGF